MILSKSQLLWAPVFSRDKGFRLKTKGHLISNIPFRVSSGLSLSCCPFLPPVPPVYVFKVESYVSVRKVIEQSQLTIDILLTAQAPTTSTAEETATQKEQWFENGRPGEYPQTPKEDSHSTAGTAGNAWFRRQTWVLNSRH